VQKTLETGVAESCADAQPVDLLLRLDAAQPDIFGVELDDGEICFQLLLLAGEQRSHQADPLGPSALELFNGLLHAAVLPQRTSASGASFLASGKWLYHSTCMVIFSPAGTRVGLDGPWPAVTHCGALPAVVGHHQ